MKPITVISRLGELPGFSNGTVAFFDRFDERVDKEIRHYILLKEGIKLMYEPWGWKERWYIDLVAVEEPDAGTVRLEDKYIDIIVEGNGPLFKIVDLEQYGQALEEGHLTVQEASVLLARLQSFLDQYLQRNHDFPPASIRALRP